MPLVDKLERISALLQSGTLTQEEFHQAKDQLLKPAAPAVTDAPDALKTRDRWMKDLAQAEREFRIVRHHCMIRDRHSALREPSVGRLYLLTIVLGTWLGLGGMAISGFLAVNRTLALFPALTMFIGGLFLIRAIVAHAFRMVRLAVAKRKWEQKRLQIRENLAR